MIAQWYLTTDKAMQQRLNFKIVWESLGNNANLMVAHHDQGDSTKTRFQIYVRILMKELHFDETSWKYIMF